ncbi:MAG: (d)CMP kinase [Clostridia bacterium]
MDNIINIAIDGPSGAGKSTLSKMVAQKLGYLYIDTGALYRAIALSAINLNLDPSCEEDIIPMLTSINIEMKHIDGNQKVLLNGVDVSLDIRKNNVSMAASKISALVPVRDFLLSLQRDIASKNNCIMDGRDIGTVILPNAFIKIFLTASPEDRARRRYDELVQRGETINFDTLLLEIKERDYNDSHRKIAPLMPSKQSIVVDTTGNTLEESMATLYSIIRSKLDDVI